MQTITKRELERPYSHQTKQTTNDGYRDRQGHCQQQENRHMDQWNRTENPGRNLHMIQQGENSPSKKESQDNWPSTYKRMNVDPYLTSSPKPNSDCVTDRNVRTDYTIPSKNHKNKSL